MLDAFIIERIERLRQEQERAREGERPRLHIEAPHPAGWEVPQAPPEPRLERGVVVVDFSI